MLDCSFSIFLLASNSMVSVQKYQHKHHGRILKTGEKQKNLMRAKVPMTIISKNNLHLWKYAFKKKKSPTLALVPLPKGFQWNLASNSQNSMHEWLFKSTVGIINTWKVCLWQQELTQVTHFFLSSKLCIPQKKATSDPKCNMTQECVKKSWPAAEHMIHVTMLFFTEKKIHVVKRCLILLWVHHPYDDGAKLSEKKSWPAAELVWFAMVLLLAGAPFGLLLWGRRCKMF